MGIFDRFKKSAPTYSVVSPVNGTAMTITEVADPVFSSLAMGNGVGVKPEDIQLYSPIEGKVVSIFPTKHAIGLECSAGEVEVLVHIGIETVNLNGEGFDLSVSQGQKVKQGEPIGMVDFATLEAKGYDTTVMVVVLNSPSFKEFDYSVGRKNAGDTIMTFQEK